MGTKKSPDTAILTGWHVYEGGAFGSTDLYKIFFIQILYKKKFV